MRILRLLLALATALPLSAATYYVSSVGDDANSGLSPTAAWRTIDRVNRGVFLEGDSVLFEAGRQFAGAIILDRNNLRGTATRPVTIGSYGTGRALLRSNDSGIFIIESAAVEIQNLILVGLASRSGSSGISFVSSRNELLERIAIRNVDLSSFTTGIQISVTSGLGRYRDITIRDSTIHGNATGIAMTGYRSLPSQSGLRYAIAGVRMIRNEIFNNTGLGLNGPVGAGVFLTNVDDIFIAGNAIHDNGGDNPDEAADGPSALTLHDTSRVTIEHNEIFAQRFHQMNLSDNGGLDISAVDALVQHNFIHDNEGAGLIVTGTDPRRGAPLNTAPTRDITIRYNLISNNGRAFSPFEPRPPYAGAQLFVNGKVDRLYVIHNTIFADGNVPQVTPPEKILGLVHLLDAPVVDTVPWSDLHFQNNLMIALDNQTFLDIPRPTAGPGLLFQGNAYLTDDSLYRIEWGTTMFTRVEDWSSATGQEQEGGNLLRRIVQTIAICSFAPPKTAFPRSITTVRGLRLKPDSPLINAGIDLRGTASDPGPRDYMGRVLSPDGRPDIGAYDFRPGDSCDTRRRGVR